jgi:hypothetical protein
MDIDLFVQQLAERAQPVARLLAPWRRTVLWLAASLLLSASQWLHICWRTAACGPRSNRVSFWINWNDSVKRACSA